MAPELPAPTVSVIVPVYNRGEAVRRTLDSVLAQTWTDWELLLVDDGSTDGITPSILGEYAGPKVRLLPQPNGGGAAARRFGLQHARGRYVAFLDHDDRWTPDKLARQVAHLEALPEAGLVYSGLLYTDEEGADLGPIELPSPIGRVYHELLTQHNFLYTMSNPLIRADLLREVGGPDPEAGLSDDWDLFLRLAQRAPFVFIAARLVHYNVGNNAAQTRDPEKVWRSEANLIERALARDPDLPAPVRRTVRAEFHRRFAPAFREAGWHALRAGECRRAWPAYLRALRYRPAYLGDPGFRRDLCSLALRSVRP